MKFHDLEQGSQEWLEFRRTHVGASEAPTVLLGNKETLLKSKVQGKHAFKTKAMQRGHDLEPQARWMFEEGKGALFQSAVVTHDVLDWMSASLDGICEERREIVEIKCCNDEVHEGAKRGEIPKEHLIQIQHQLFVTDYNLAHYCHFNGKEIVIVEIKRDDSLINEIVKQCGAFYKILCDAFNKPHEESEEISAPIFEHKYGSMLMKELMEIRAQKVPLCKREKQLREEILELAPDHNFVLEGILVHRSKGKVTYDFKQMKMDGIDLSKYEKIGDPVWTISSL